jgi:hypothetical protein
MDTKTRMMANQMKAVEEEKKAGQRQLAIKQVRHSNTSCSPLSQS